MKGYTAVLFILISVFIGMLFLRNDVEANILRLPGQLYERKADDIISNVYTYKLVNKTNEDITDVTLKVQSHDGTIQVVGAHELQVPARGLSEGTLFIEIRAADLSCDKDRLEIGIYSGDQLIETTTTAFLGPRSFN